MILKGSQRGGARQLAAHLSRLDDNEHVELHEFRGFVSDDVNGALREAQAVSKGTRCHQFLFSVSLNPPEHERVPVQAFEDAVDRIEHRTGLSGHPRIVLFHEKEGRRHAHAVWSRIDAETMTAKNLSHYKLKLRDVSRELYREHGWEMPAGLKDARDKDPRNFTLEEWQQAGRMGRDPREVKAAVQQCWTGSRDKDSLARALEARGFMLAQGDRRGHVAVSHDGEVLSVARATGQKAKDVRARLGGPDDLPDVKTARARQAGAMDQAFRRHMAQAQRQKQQDLAPLEARRQAMTEQHRSERARLDQKQQERSKVETRARQARFDQGLRGLWHELSGKHARIRDQNERSAWASLQRDRKQRDDLIMAQLKDRQALQQEIRAVRERYAEMLMNLRQDRKHVHAMLQDKDQAVTRRRPDERLSALRARHPDQIRQDQSKRTDTLRSSDRPRRGRSERGHGRER